MMICFYLTVFNFSSCHALRSLLTGLLSFFILGNYMVKMDAKTRAVALLTGRCQTIVSVKPNR